MGFLVFVLGPFLFSVFCGTWLRREMFCPFSKLECACFVTGKASLAVPDASAGSGVAGAVDGGQAGGGGGGGGWSGNGGGVRRG